MTGRTKYLLLAAVGFGVVMSQPPEPALARGASGGLKFRVLLPTLKKSRTLDIYERPLTFSRDGRTLACSVSTHNRVSRKDNGSSMLRDVRSGRVLRSVPWHSSFAAGTAAMSGANIWIGCAGQFTGVVEKSSTSHPKWRVLAKGYGIYDKQGYSRGFRGLDPVGALVASPDGSKLLVGIFGEGEMSSWGKVLLMDARTGRVTRNLPGSPGPAVNAVAFSPDGRTVAWGDLDGGVRLCSTRAGARTRRLRSGNPNGPPVTAVAFRGRDELVSVDEKGSIRFWNARTGRLKRTLKESELSKWNVTRLVLSPNGHALAVSYEGGFMRLYAIP